MRSKALMKIFLTIILLGTSVVFVLQSAKAQIGCSAQESELISKYIQDSLQAFISGDFIKIGQLEQQLRSEISPDCWNTLSQSNQFQPYSGEDLGLPPNIYDHGDGTLVMPGQGASTPRGFIPFD